MHGTSASVINDGPRPWQTLRMNLTRGITRTAVSQSVQHGSTTTSVNDQRAYLASRKNAVARAILTKCPSKRYTDHPKTQ